MSEPTHQASQECTHCGAEIEAGDDFCRECGHSVGFSERLADGVLDDDHNAGVICPACGATHMVRSPSGRFVCESCDHEL